MGNLEISLSTQTNNSKRLSIENENLTINYKNSNEENAKNIQNYKNQIEDFIKMKKKSEVEFSEKDCKRKNLLNEYENLKKENIALNEKINLSTIELINKNSEWNIIKIKFEENIKNSENENKKLKTKIE